jgi:hypothetical protein
VSAGLKISQLELMTLAFVVCALVMYGFWWDKPFDAEREIILTCRDDVQPRYQEKSSTERETNLDWDKVVKLVFGVVQLDDASDITVSLPCVALYATGIVFSALHIAAWNWEFPSPTLQTVWRILGVAASGAALAPVITFPIVSAIRDLSLDSFVGAIALMDLFFWIVYIISRLGLIVLVFYCFSSMPASVYMTVDWTNFLPHFS